MGIQWNGLGKRDANRFSWTEANRTQKSPGGSCLGPDFFSLIASY
jgi:hypothetical protein